MGKWQDGLVSDNLLQRYKSSQFIGIITEAEVMVDFDVDLYFALVEKMVVFDDSRIVVSLLDGTELECIIE